MHELQAIFPVQLMGMGSLSKNMLGSILFYKKDPMSTLNRPLVSLIWTITYMLIPAAAGTSDTVAFNHRLMCNMDPKP